MSGREPAGVVAERFAAFTAPFLAEPGDTFAYRLKVEHTGRVVGLAGVICAGENISGDAALAARIAAQLHDVGRFPQYKRYRTFRDIDSADHAALSVRHILRARMLEGVPGPICRLVLGAVYLHNKRRLPPGLPPRLDSVARVVRDSDKLDIYKIMIEHFGRQSSAQHEVELNVKADPTAYSAPALEALLQRRAGEYAKLVWVNDFKLLLAGWLYDLNFRTSCRLLKERGYLDAVFDSLPDDAGIRRARRQVLGDLALRS